jgi:hypothetical protein
MPLHKHFRNTDADVNGGDGRSFLCRWVCGVGTELDKQLPGGNYVVWVRTRTKLKLEQRIASFEDGPPMIYYDERESETRFPSFEPTPPLLSVPAVFDDDFNVRVMDSCEGPTIAAIVAFVCPSNKHSRASGHAFAERMCAYIRHGIGVVVIDIVNGMQSSWLPFLARSFGFSDQIAPMRDVETCAVSLRPRFRDNQGSVEVWCERLQIEQKMPVLPLAVRSGMFLKLDLEQSYETTLDQGGYRNRPYLFA